MTEDPYAISTLAQLRGHYDLPHSRVTKKVADRLGPRSLAFIAASPFAILGTCRHTSPRGDAPGFVQALDDTTLALPDRRGNNRLDALQDLLDDPAASLLFLIPGVGETLRINGTARITADPALRGRFAVAGNLPATVILITVREVYAHCAKALLRSGLWGEERARPPGVPSNGELIAEATRGEAVDPARYETEYQARIRRELY
jgi:PPOX class probable FMN-dependent enzyme